MVLGQPDSHLQKVMLDPYIILHIKLKIIIDINIRAKTIKFLEENTDMHLLDPGLDNGFLNMTPKAQVAKGNIDKLNYIKIKTFCASKAIMKKVKRKPTKQEKLFANHLSDCYSDYIKNS